MSGIFDEIIRPDAGLANPTDATFVGAGLPPMNTGASVNSDLELTRGTWLFVIKNPSGNTLKNFKPKDLVAKWLEGDTYSSKTFTLDRVAFLPGTNHLELEITIEDNPIPLFVIWAVIFGLVSLGALLTNRSVLERVERLAGTARTAVGSVVTGAVDTVADSIRKVTSAVTEPITLPLIIIAVVAVFVAPLILRKS